MDKQKYTVTVTQSCPPYAPEAVLIVEASCEDEAKRKAYGWVLSQYTFFAEAGAVREEELDEDIFLIDLTKGNHAS